MVYGLNQGARRVIKTKPIILNVILVAILSIFAGACSTSEPPAPPPILTPIAAIETSPTKEAEDAPTDEIQEEPDKPLADVGPLWVFSTADGLFAVHPDGSGLTRFYQGPINPPYSRQILAAPSDGYIAYLTGNNFANTTLRITKFSGTQLDIEIPLTSDESEPGAESMPGDPEVEAVRAMTEGQSLAFSPDGSYLAFMGAIDGPTSDLYLISLKDQQITWLTDGPSQGYQPVWSPDGKYIVHTGVRTFGTGAGYSMMGVWAARADGSGVVTLYDPSKSGSEEIMGWVDTQTFLVHSWDAVCGPKNLRTYNIETKERVVLWPGYFQSITFNPSNAVAVLSYWMEGCNPDTEKGVYLVPTDGRDPLLVVEDKVTLVTWSQEANLILAMSEFGVLAIDSNGQFINLDRPHGADPFPAVAPGSKDLAWPGDSLWIGPLLGSIDNPPQEIFTESVYTVTWDPSGVYVLFFAENGLYSAQKPDYIPILITEGLDNQNGYSGWVMP